MATTFTDLTGDGNNNKPFSFPSYQVGDVKVEVDNVVKSATTHYNITSYTTTGGGTVVFTSGNIPANGAAIRIYRDTDVDSAKATYQAGSSVKADDLNNNQTQLLYASQEEQNQTVTTSRIKNGAVTSDKILDGTIANADISASAEIAVSKLADGAARQILQTDSGGSGVEWTNNLDIPGTLDVTGATTLDGTLTVTGTTNLAANSIGTSEVADNAITADKINNGEITSAKLNASTVVTNSEHAASSPNDTSFFTTSATDARYFRQDSTETITSGVTWSGSDSYVATTGAIDARIIDLVDDVGGFVPIANETSFPNANPDVNNPATGGTIVSVAALSTSYTSNGSGVITIANGNVGNGQTITINGLGNNTTYGPNNGLLVETTSTDHTYTFHRLSPKATEVTTVAGISANVTTVAGIASNVTTVAGISSNVTSVAGKSTEIGRLGTADAVADLNTLGTADVVADMNTLGTSDVVSDMDTLAGISANITTAANNNANITTVAGANANITTVAGAITNVNNVGGAITNVNAVASNIADVHNYADLYQVATSAPTARSDSTALSAGDMWFDSSSNKELKIHNGTAYQLVTPSQSVLNDISVVSGNITYEEDLGLITDAVATGTGNSIETCADNITKITTVHTNIANVNTTAGSIANVNTTAGSIANVNTVGAAIGNVNRYADEYSISSSTPGSPSEGDLWYNTTANTLNYYNSSSWVGISPGISAVISDTSPGLGGHLDCNDKNLTEVATVSGDNLQIDFGTLT